MNKNYRIIFTTGGSGGHITTAQSVIEELIDNGIKKSDILFIGGDLSKHYETKAITLEEKVIKGLGIDFVKIRTGKLNRKFSIKNTLLMFRTILGFYDSYKIFQNIKCNKIISFGGYVTVPVCLISKIKGYKIYLHEQTAAIGLSNKIVSYFADKIFVNFESSIKFFKNKNVIHTGNPIRKMFFENITSLKSYDIDIVNVVNWAKKNNKKLIYVTGGGQGSELINNLIINNLDKLLNKYCIILQAGSHNFDKNMEIVKSIQDIVLLKCFVMKEFINKEVFLVLKNSDIIVSRGGAGIITELGVLKKKCILIPIKHVTHNEQYLNCKILEENKQAIILDEGLLTYDVFSKSLENVLNLKYENINKFPTNASKIIVKEINIL